MNEILFDAIMGGLMLGSVSYLSNVYGKDSPVFFKILAFLWSVPLTFFFFVNMASRYGKKPMEDFSKHAIFGTFFTLFLSIISYMSIRFFKELETEDIVKYCLIYALIVTLIYFIFKLYML